MKGIELSRRFHAEAVEPMIARTFPLLTYSAALLGPGSEVLGFDTGQSRDHDWGPRVCLFLEEADWEREADMRAMLEQHAPRSFHGFPVDTGMTVITTVRRFAQGCLSFDIRNPAELADWLTFPSQSLLEMTAGEVFRDERGELAALRSRFAYYPEDCRLYLLASTWQRIGQEEHLMNRAGHAGDELGSAVIGSRIVRDVMHLCFLMERVYAPYPKWLGTAFRRLACSEQLLPLLWQAQTAASWRDREQAFNAAYRELAILHDKTGLAENIPADAESFYDRPFKVMHGESVAQLLGDSIQNAELRRLAKERLIGGIDQITDNTDYRGLTRRADGEGIRLREVWKQLYLLQD